MTLAGKLHDLRYEARRVGQTTRTFDNWPDLLKQMAAQRAGRGAAELTFRVKGGPTLTVPNVPGARLAVYEQFADDSYQLDELLAPFTDRQVHALDVGAHVGSFAINLARILPRATVECFEPSASSATYLRRNVADNGLDSRITVREAALSDSVGTALLDDNDSGSVHNGLIQAGVRMVDGDDSPQTRHAVEVPTTTFDDVVKSAAAPPVIVKLDCEGGEYPLVYASSPSSWDSVERIVMEYHRVDGQSWDELGAWFADVGLHTVRHESVAPRTGTAWLSRSPRHVRKATS